MSSTAQTKDERINLRLKQHTKLMLERAASFEGQTISKFVLNSALSRAEETIQKHETMSLNANDADVFFNALAAPVQFNNTLTAALKEHSKRVTSK
ncbi:MAG: DUF1778 domain-containing protein [Nitrosomonas sp.]|nr:DUF1778 domain-containing protein [Nitrosomonas sp.]